VAFVSDAKLGFLHVDKQKAPRETAGLLFSDRDEDVPFLADLAATYSSKS
jgi:hypothetical protein